MSHWYDSEILRTFILRQLELLKDFWKSKLENWLRKRQKSTWTKLKSEAIIYGNSYTSDVSTMRIEQKPNPRQKVENFEKENGQKAKTIGKGKFSAEV